MERNDLRVGDRAPTKRHTLTVTDIVRYAGASGDFAPVHHDPSAARSAGMGSVFAHGMFTAGLLASAVTEFVGVANLVSLQTRFAEPAWPGETLETEVVVRAIRSDTSHDLVELDCFVRAGHSVKIRGSAVARSRLRARPVDKRRD